MYGTRVETNYAPDGRGVIGEVETSNTGNLILRAGRENGYQGDTWHQTEHVVLTPDEARAFIDECARHLGLVAPLLTEAEASAVLTLVAGSGEEVGERIAGKVTDALV